MALTAGAGLAYAHDWTGVAQCESSGNWHIDTGNGYYGGLQFSMDTWRDYGGVGNPADASRAEQVRIAERVLVGQGVGAWPTCGKYLRDGADPSQVIAGLVPDGVLPEGSLEGSLAPLASLDQLGSSAAGPLGSLGSL